MPHPPVGPPPIIRANVIAHLIKHHAIDTQLTYGGFTMTRKHFQCIAQAIRQNIPDAVTRQAVAEALLPALRESNERFNAEKFMDAAVGS